MRIYLSHFQGFELKFNGTDAHVVAHTCAKHDIFVGLSHVTFDVIPDFLSDVVHSDYVHLQNE